MGATETTCDRGFAMPELFSSDFGRFVMLESDERVSKAPRARRGDDGELAMTGRFAYDPRRNRHLVEYVARDGSATWLTAGGTWATSPEADGFRVREVPVTFTDGTRR